MWRPTGDLSESILFVHVLYLTYTVALNLNLKRYSNRHSVTLTAVDDLPTQLLCQRNALSKVFCSARRYQARSHFIAVAVENCQL